MSVFIDTSALYAILDADDDNHAKAKEFWKDGLKNNEAFSCHNYIIVETIALLQNRIGIESVRTFIQDILPVLDVTWIDQNRNSTGMSSLLTASRRDVSFVDCVSFDTMRSQGIRKALAFDRHFTEQGFELL